MPRRIVPIGWGNRPHNIAFETPARDGVVVNEDLMLEPGTGDPVAPGDVGGIVVTSLDPHHPRIDLRLET